MQVTMFYAGVLALLFLVLSVRVIQGRTGPAGVNLGDGGNAGLLRRIRGHGNFAEYVPLILVMLAMLEAGGLPKMWVHGFGATLLVSRLLHGYALSFSEKFMFGRFWGTTLTLLLLIVLGGLCVWRALPAL
ncbi:MAG TPA: MAPEG family protein [Solimonas sp.]|nr:MAPEG family protein [Solimonas sp.]